MSADEWAVSADEWAVSADGLEACRYVIARVRAKAGARWRQGARAQPLECESSAEEARLVAGRRLCGVPEAAARALCEWVNGRRPAILLHEAPSARALLKMSAGGRRAVSLLEDENGLEFALHDLCHLEKFVDPAHHAGQVAFFQRLDAVVDGAEWAALEEGLDGAWRGHRDHVLADMNGSAVYLYLVLRARLIDACVRAGIVPDERVRQFAALLGVASEERNALARCFI